VLDKIGIKLGTEISNNGEYNIVDSGKIIQVNNSLAENIILVLG
jgi:hypothetical protein